MRRHVLSLLALSWLTSSGCHLFFPAHDPIEGLAERACQFEERRQLDWNKRKYGGNDQTPDTAPRSEP